jgi:hypothetical protein
MSAETNCLATDQRNAPQTQVERIVGMIGRPAALRRVVAARTASRAGFQAPFSPGARLTALAEWPDWVAVPSTAWPCA